MSTVNIPIREVQSPGMIMDTPPSSLPASAWSKARNMMFSGKGASRAPHFIRLASTTTMPEVYHVVGKRYSSEGFDDTYVFGPLGECGVFRGLERYEDLSPEPFTPSPPPTPNQPYSSCVLADILYVNRADIGIRYVSESGMHFKPIPNLDSAWTCLVLRSYKDYLIALNVTKDGTTYSNLVKWSDAALNGQVPSNWDYTLSGDNKSSLAGENPLAELRGPILDGLGLGNSFIIYGRDEVWVMEDAGNSTDVFTFRRQFGEGIKGTNCVVEVNGTHFVFGSTQLYMHDGITPTPIQLRLNNETVYSRLDPTRTEECFVCHDNVNKVVLFCYPRVGSTACDEALAYNYVEKTACLIDLPNLHTATNATPYGWYSWEDNGSHDWTYDEANDPGPSWADDVNTYVPSLLMGGSGASQGTLWRYGNLAGTSDAADASNNYTGILERSGVLLDNEQLTGANVPLIGSKRVNRVVPLVGDQTAPVSVSIAGTMLDLDTPKWVSLGTFDAATQYKLDGNRVNGRSLHIHIEIPPTDWATLVGYDVTVQGYGNR